MNYIFAVALMALLCASIYSGILKYQLNVCRENTEILQSTIKFQNEQINQHKIPAKDTTDSSIKEVIKWKYKEVAIPIKDPSCEVKLNAITEITDIYFYGTSGSKQP